MAVMKVGAAGIETISGALKRPKKQNGHSHGNYLVATHRVAATTNPNCQHVYTFEADRYERSTQPTSKELAVRARFTASGPPRLPPRSPPPQAARASRFFRFPCIVVKVRSLPRSRGQLGYSITKLISCQAFFSSFFKKSF